VVSYGENSPIEPVTTEALLAQGAIVRPLGIAARPLSVPRSQRKFGSPTQELNSGSAPRSAPLRLELRGDRQIIGSWDPIEFRTLAAGSPSLTDGQNEVRFLADFIRPSYWQFEALTPSAWTGHIPFMFCLTAMLRPRRFAELGTHYGASFLAYCQAAKRLGFQTQAVAIDCWEGDDHTGAYDDTVFDQFLVLLQEYAGFATYLRMLFEDAAQRFETGSLDLLHIDGFHTYEAVKNDFETWLPKLSERGVVIFHDINVHERDFGVWRFWKEVKQHYPTLEFRHSHGLGLAYVGKPGATPIERLISVMNGSEESNDLLQQHFEEVGQKSTELYTSRFDLQQREIQLQALGLASEEVSRLRQELSVLRTEREQWLAAARAKFSN
jgi:hypothetical protein